MKLGLKGAQNAALAAGQFANLNDQRVGQIFKYLTLYLLPFVRRARASTVLLRNLLAILEADADTLRRQIKSGK